MQDSVSEQSKLDLQPMVETSVAVIRQEVILIYVEINVCENLRGMQLVRASPP